MIVFIEIFFVVKVKDFYMWGYMCIRLMFVVIYNMVSFSLD